MNKLALPTLEHAPADGRIGIVDIGSNSVRLVIYDQQKRSPVSIYNEKVMCGLGKGLAATGMLNPQGVEEAKLALSRFIAMGRNMDIKSLYVMATAAVRDAKDGKTFVEYLEKTHAISIDIISGEKEARLGAYGICSSIHHPTGITGDLGGGSLELIWMNNCEIEDHTSLALGSLRMYDETKGDRDKIKKLIIKRFGELDWLDDYQTPTFYAIGGSFRALAKMHMEANSYPLHILHEYTIASKECFAFLREILSLSDAKLEKYPGSAAKRVPQLAGAALLLEHILTLTKAQQVTFSASGIREGYIFEMLPPELRTEDGLISSCNELASRGGRTVAYAHELNEWMSPLTAHETENNKRLQLAFCLLSEVALHIHPEYRAEWAFNRIISSALTCLTHSERVKLALAMYHRYQYKFKKEAPELALISEADKRWAKCVGTAANLAYHLSGSISGNLPFATLSLNKTAISLNLADKMKYITGDAITKRLGGLNETYALYSKK